MKKWGHWIHQQLHHPTRVLMTCLALAFISLLLNRGGLNLWSLHRDQKKLTDQIQAVKLQTADLEGMLKKAKDPSYIERQAMDRYDLAEEHDLVFVFADE